MSYSAPEPAGSWSLGNSVGFYCATRINIRNGGWRYSGHFNKPQAASPAKSVEQVLVLGVDNGESHKIFTSLVPFGYIAGIPA